jgi:ATP-binding cassette subfamily B protein
VPKKPLSFFDVIRFASGYWSKQPRKLAVVMFLLVLAAVIETYIPNALSSFLGAIRQKGGEGAILHRLMIFLGAYLAQALLSSTAYLIYNVFETNIFKAVLDDAFAYVYRLPEYFFANTFTGSIISKINRARQKIETFEDQIILRIFSTAVVLVGTIGFLSLRFPMLAVLMTAYLFVLAAASSFLVFKVSGPAQGAYADAQDHFGAHLADSVSGIPTTKSYAQEKTELMRFQERTGALRVKNVRAYILGNTAGFVQRLLLMGMLALLLGGGTWYLFHGQATVESMAYLAFAYTIVQSYIRELGENIKNLLTASYDLHAIIEMMQETPEVPLTPALPALEIRQGAIAFENISFTYPGKPAPIFKNFSIPIRAGLPG